LSAKLHANGTTDTWEASTALLRFLDDALKPGMRTLETGAGRSTLMFARKGAVHAAVTPAGAEIAAIQAEAERLGVDLSRVTFHNAFSQDVLPSLASGEEDLDIVFIDGGHGFPDPAIDFQYLAPRLKVGGLLLIDDVDLWTGDMIVKVLRRERGWAYERKLQGRTAVFQKTAPFCAAEWTEQPYVAASSFWPQTMRKAGNGLALLLRGDFGRAASKFSREFA
jgi:predicted O-methyltransferase YrrM